MFDRKPQSRVRRVATSSYPRMRRSVEGLRAERWFDGTTESIYAREERVRTALRQVREFLASDAHMEDGMRAHVLEWADGLEEEQRTLGKVAQEYVEASYEDQISSLPQYGVMAGSRKMYKRPVAATAEKIAELEREWRKFCHVEPQVLVSRLGHLLGDESGMREQAVDFVVEATLDIDDERIRARVIDTFVSNVERLRRHHVGRVREAKIASPPREVSRRTLAADSLLFD